MDNSFPEISSEEGRILLEKIHNLLCPVLREGLSDADRETWKMLAKRLRAYRRATRTSLKDVGKEIKLHPRTLYFIERTGLPPVRGRAAKTIRRKIESLWS